MKKLLLLTTMFFCLMPSWSQEVTQQNLQGKWKIVEYSSAGATLDIASGKVTLDKDAFNFGKDRTDELKGKMESYTNMLKTSYLEIDGNKYTQLIGDSILVGTFTLEYKEKNTLLHGQFDNGSKGTIHLAFNRGKLYLYFPAQNKQYVYTKA